MSPATYQHGPLMRHLPRLLSLVTACHCMPRLLVASNVLLCLFTTRFRLKSDRWKCNRCQSKATMLARCGVREADLTLPEIPLAERSAFWSSDMKIDKLRVEAEKLLSSYSRRERWFSEGGAFLPLSVWQTKGWDVERLKANTPPEDIRETAQGGTCYRVRILSQGESGVEGKSQERKEAAQDQKRQKLMMQQVEELQKKLAEQVELAQQQAQSSAASSSQLSDRVFSGRPARPAAVVERQQEQVCSNGSSSSSNGSSTSSDIASVCAFVLLLCTAPCSP